MTNRLECAGVTLEGKRPDFNALVPNHDIRWYVDGEPQKNADDAFDLWAARIYGSSQELPTAITRYIRTFAGLQLASPQTMVRRARERGGFKSQRAFARAAEVAHSTVQRIESGRTDPTASVLFKLLHVANR